MAKKTKYTLRFETREEANAFIRWLEFRTILEKVKSAHYEEDADNFQPFAVRFTLEKVKA